MARDKRLNKYRELKNDRRFSVIEAWCGYVKPKFGIFWPLGFASWDSECLGWCDTEKEAVDYCEKLSALGYGIRSDLQKLDQKELKAYVASH